MRANTLVLVLLTGCAGAATTTGDLTTLRADGPCLVDADSIKTAQWQQVRGPGFVFCVPADWRQTSDVVWSTAGGSVGWHPGRIAALTSHARVGTPAAPMPEMRGKRESFTESIGGVTVRLWRTEVDARHHVGAQWDDRVVMYMTGSGLNASALDLQLDIFRTVRLTDRTADTP